MGLSSDIVDHCIVPYLEFGIFYPLRYRYLGEYQKRIYHPSSETYLVAIENNDVWLFSMLIQCSIEKKVQQAKYCGTLISQSMFLIRFLPIATMEIQQQIRNFLARHEALSLLNHEEEDCTYPEPDNQLMKLRETTSVIGWKQYNQEVRMRILNLDVYGHLALTNRDEYLNILHLLFGYIDHSDQTEDYTLNSRNLGKLKQVLLMRKEQGCYLGSDLYLEHHSVDILDLLSNEERQMLFEDILYTRYCFELEYVVDCASTYIKLYDLPLQDVYEKLCRIHGEEAIRQADYYEQLQ